MKECKGKTSQEIPALGKWEVRSFRFAPSSELQVDVGPTFDPPID